MARSTPTKRQKRALGTLLEKGVIATFMGVAFLMAPLVFGAYPILKPVSAGLRLPGWLALGVGLVLMAIHFALKRKAEATSRPPNVVPLKREPKLVSAVAETMPTPALNGVAAIAARAPASATTLPQPSSTWSPAVFDTTVVLHSRHHER